MAKASEGGWINTEQSRKTEGMRITKHGRKVMVNREQHKGLYRAHKMSNMMRENKVERKSSALIINGTLWYLLRVVHVILPTL